MPSLEKYVLGLDREGGTGIYYLYWRANGHQKRKSLKTRDRDQAEKAKAHYIIHHEHDLQAAKAAGIEPTIADLWAIYAKEHLTKTNGYYNATTKWNSCMHPYFGHLTVPQVVRSVVKEYVRKRMAGEIVSKKTGRAVKESSVRQEIMMLKNCLNFCTTVKDDDDKPMLDKSAIRSFETPAAGEPRQRALDRDEIRKLYDAAATFRGPDGKLSRIELFLYLAINTCGREEAILDLTYGRVDFDNRIINLQHDDYRKDDGKKKRAKGVPIN